MNLTPKLQGTRINTEKYHLYPFHQDGKGLVQVAMKTSDHDIMLKAINSTGIEELIAWLDFDESDLRKIINNRGHIYHEVVPYFRTKVVQRIKELGGAY